MIGCYRHLTPNGVLKYEKKSCRDCMSIKALNKTNTNSVGVQQGGLNSMQISLPLEHSQMCLSVRVLKCLRVFIETCL
jgi:hypothetical protein